MLVLKRGRWVVSKTLILIFLGIHWFISELRVELMTMKLYKYIQQILFIRSNSLVVCVTPKITLEREDKPGNCTTLQD